MGDYLVDISIFVVWFSDVEVLYNFNVVKVVKFVIG